jgi:hypothetical protein
MSPERKKEREKNAIYIGHLRLCQQPRAAHALRSDQNFEEILRVALLSPTCILVNLWTILLTSLLLVFLIKNVHIFCQICLRTRFSVLHLSHVCINIPYFRSLLMTKHIIIQCCRGLIMTMLLVIQYYRGWIITKLITIPFCRMSTWNHPGCGTFLNETGHY